jgi:tetratricopeptide (TPR) repeat protein
MKYIDAAQKYKEAIEIDPNSASCWNNLSVCCGGLRMYLDMKSKAQKCLDVDPNFHSHVGK